MPFVGVMGLTLSCSHAVLCCESDSVSESNTLNQNDKISYHHYHSLPCILVNICRAFVAVNRLCYCMSPWPRGLHYSLSFQLQSLILQILLLYISFKTLKHIEDKNRDL